MYFKVASIAVAGIFLSGCSATSNPEPKKPDVKVVEEVDNNITTLESENNNTSWSPAKTVEKKYKLKPEPFSLESNEDDPELLGPQSTIDRSLDSSDKPAPTEKKSKKPVVRKAKQAKDKFEKAKDETVKEENLPSGDNKKEAL